MQLKIKPLSNSPALAHSSIVLRLTGDEPVSEITVMLGQLLAIPSEKIQLLFQGRKLNPGDQFNKLSYSAENIQCLAKINTPLPCTLPHSDEFVFLETVLQQAKSLALFSWENLILLYHEHLHLLKDDPNREVFIKTDMHADEIVQLKSMVDDLPGLKAVENTKLKEFIADHQKGFTWMLTNYQDDILLDQNQSIKSFLEQWINLIDKSMYILEDVANTEERKQLPTDGLNERLGIFAHAKKNKAPLKYENLHLIATDLPGAIKFMLYAAQQQIKHIEPFRIQLLIDIGHTTCIDLQISKDALCAVILDSINDIKGIEPLLKTMHEANFHTTLVVSNLASTKSSEIIPKTMQTDMYSCKKYAISFALRAGKIPDFHAQCLLAVTTEADNTWVKYNKQIRPDYPWLNYITWSALNPKFMKYSQSETFARAHGFFGDLKSPTVIQNKILSVTSQQANQFEDLLDGPVTQARKLGL